MNWFLFAIGSVVALAVAELSLQNILNRRKAFPSRTVVFLGCCLQLVVILPFAIYFYGMEIFSIFTPEIFPRVLAVCVISAIATLFYTKGFKVKSISISSIFVSLSMVVSTALGIYFFNEGISALKFVGIAAILISIIILNIKNATLEKNNFYGLVAGALYGITFVIDKGTLQTISPPVYIIWILLFTAFICFISNPNEVVTSLKNKSLPSFSIIALSALGFLFYNLLTYFAYTTGGEVGKVDAINNSQIFLIILFEFFILKQKTSIVRKIVASLIAFVGVLILGLWQ